MKNKINCNMHLSDCKNLKEDIKLQANSEYSLELDYPLNETVIFKIKTVDEIGGFGILGEIYKCYKEAYKNRKNTWGHAMGDLFIEGISIDHEKKTIKLEMGS